jgi:hypothetical protein
MRLAAGLFGVGSVDVHGRHTESLEAATEIKRSVVLARLLSEPVSRVLVCRSLASDALGERMSMRHKSTESRARKSATKPSDRYSTP